MLDLEQILIKAIKDELQLSDVTSLCEEIRKLRKRPDAKQVKELETRNEQLKSQLREKLKSERKEPGNKISFGEIDKNQVTEDTVKFGHLQNQLKAGISHG